MGNIMCRREIINTINIIIIIFIIKLCISWKICQFFTTWPVTTGLSLMCLSFLISLCVLGSLGECLLNYEGIMYIRYIPNIHTMHDLKDRHHNVSNMLWIHNTHKHDNIHNQNNIHKELFAIHKLEIMNIINVSWPYGHGVGLTIVWSSVRALPRTYTVAPSWCGLECRSRIDGRIHQSHFFNKIIIICITWLSISRKN
jgi:hypothetical protein